MWKVLWSLMFVAMVVGQNATDLSPKLPQTAPLVNNASSALNESAKATDNKKEATTKIPTDAVKFDDNADIGSPENPIDPLRFAKLDEESIGNFKYYFFLLLVSSLSVISIIVYKTLRLRRSRAEIKYGKASVSDRSETQPLGKQQWLEESSDENEDEIFDINFLKNKRTQIV